MKYWFLGLFFVVVLSWATLFLTPEGGEIGHYSATAPSLLGMVLCAVAVAFVWLVIIRAVFGRK